MCVLLYRTSTLATHYQQDSAKKAQVPICACNVFYFLVDAGKGFADELASRGLNIVLVSRTLEKLQVGNVLATTGSEIVFGPVDHRGLIFKTAF